MACGINIQLRIYNILHLLEDEIKDEMCTRAPYLLSPAGKFYFTKQFHILVPTDRSAHLTLLHVLRIYRVFSYFFIYLRKKWVTA